jgi:exopolysaccharide biosynthesis polyprenyl glycosylphosphotransferase
VEPLPRRTVKESAITLGAAPSPQRSSPPRDKPASRSDTPIRIRLGLQRRAPRTLRRHLLRDARRVVALVVADLVSFAVMRALLRAVRDQGSLGTAFGERVATLLPAGILNGWQYAAALILALFVTQNYAAGDRRRDPRRLFIACALATALPLWMTIWTRGLEVVSVQYVLTTGLVWAGLLTERQMLNRIVAWVVPPERNASRTLFVGPEESCRETAEGAAFAQGGDYRRVGFIDVHLPPAPDALGHVVDFARVLDETRAETVVVCGHLSDTWFEQIVDLSLAAGCQLLSVPRAVQVAGVQPNLVWRRDQPLVELTAPSLKGWQLLLKRLVDLAGAAVILLVAGVPMLLIAVLIKFDSRGPVFFRQDRIGTGGSRFRVWKFRTMRHGASDAAHRALIAQLFSGEDASAGHAASNGERVYKLVDDERVTGLGRWLRRTSLDELPQLFNVVRGEMSLVGPRPPLVYEFEAYDHWQFDRLQVKPGITGLWQVSGRNLLTYRQMCELDLEYVRRWSLWLDLQILWKTVPVVLFNSGRAA